MRRTFVAGLMSVAVSMIFETAVAEAQVSTPRNPWCIRDGALGGGSWDCSYRTFEQCRVGAEGAGGTCYPNPNYQGARQPTTRRQQQSPDGNWGWGGQRW